MITQARSYSEVSEVPFQGEIANYTTHSPIMITDDDDFVSYGFSGNGTGGDPYIIENLYIFTSAEIGINIEFTSKYFVIRNCYIDAEYRAINIEEVNVGTAKIINNTCIDNSFLGIRLYLCPGALIVNNTCINSRDGIHVHSSPMVKITNNTCIENYYQGIKIEYSTGVKLTNNTCNQNNVRGIHIWESSLVELVNNTCNYNDDSGILVYQSSSAILLNNTLNHNEIHGIYLSVSSGTILRNNILQNNGLEIKDYGVSSYLSYTIENNWVNKKILGFVINIDNKSYDEPLYGQLILINCSNVEVRNQVFNKINIGASLISCRDSLLINNTLKENSQGILIKGSEKINITQNTFCDNLLDGIFLLTCSFIRIINNTCQGNLITGIYLEACNDILITQNLCKENSQGIQLDSTDSTLIIFNTLLKNREYGIFIESGSNNSIHHNNFTRNNLNGTSQGFSQAYDAGEDNTWWEEETEEGNHWSDWTKRKPYKIDGQAESFDRYPLNDEMNRISYPVLILIPLILHLIISSRFSRKRKLEISS
jgi:parallel beta-helix repeat protein